VVCGDSIGRSLLDAASCAAAQRDCRHLDYVPLAGRHLDLPAHLRQLAQADDAWNQSVTPHDAGRIDVSAVAEWIVGHYPARAYPAVVLGSPHGGAVHLAAALGAAWLPTGFTVTVRWPGGDVGDWRSALDAGGAVAERLLAAEPDVTVRQVHDPLSSGMLCASTLTLHVRWRRLPPAYRAFLHNRLAPGAETLLLRDVRTWPVLNATHGHTFQLGSPVSGCRPGDYTMDNPSFARLLERLGGEQWVGSGAARSRYAETAGEPEFEFDLRHATLEAGRLTRRVLYPNPETLSACVADLYRERLRARGRAAEGCVVETGRQLDPWQVLTAGLVPYWCETASRHAVTAAEWWLAGSNRFDSLDVLPAPPGSAHDALANRRQWTSIAAFARSRGNVDREALRRYPLHPLPTGHAAAVLQGRPRHASAPPRMRMTEVLDGLRGSGQSAGVLVL
jgi:hypothetical protein